MKTFLILVIVAFPLNFVIAQQNSKTDCEKQFDHWKELQDSTNREWVGDSTFPEVLKSEPVVYPDSAAKKHIEGEVTIWLLVDTSGKVRCARILKSAGYGFDEAALSSIYKWTFKPVESQGHKIESAMIMPLKFRPDNKK
jgi:TonB family protein